MTLLDRRTFLARGAAGMLSVAAVERLVARSALAATAADSAYGYGPIQPTPDQHGRLILSLPAGLLVRDVRRDRLDDVGRQRHAAGARRHGGVPRTRRNGAADPQPRGPQPAGRRQRRRARGGEVRHVRRRRHDDARLRPAIADARARLHLAERDDRELRRRVRARPRAPGSPARRRSAGQGIVDPAKQFARRHGYLFEVPLDRRPNELAPGVPLREAGRFSHEAASTDQRTGIVYETEDPGSGRGAGFYRYIPKDPQKLTAGGRLQILGIQDKPLYDAREGQTVGRKLPVRWIDIPEPDPEYVNDDDPRGTFRQGRRLGRDPVQPARGLLVRRGRRQHLLRLDQRRRQEERRPQLRRLPRGLRPGLGVPAARALRRAADPALRVAGPRGDGLAGQHDGDAGRWAAARRGRRVRQPTASTSTASSASRRPASRSSSRAASSRPSWPASASAPTARRRS